MASAFESNPADHRNLMKQGKLVSTYRAEAPGGDQFAAGSDTIFDGAEVGTDHSAKDAAAYQQDDKVRWIHDRLP